MFLLIISNNLIQVTGISKHKTVQAHLKNSSRFLKYEETVENIKKNETLEKKV